MPKLYEYLGLAVFFYANEHEPIHVHGRRQGRECKAELIIVDGKIVEVRFSDISGKPSLESGELRDFESLVRAKADEIVEKWVDFFVRHKHVQTEIINQRIK
jgi:hypothetical protein